MPLPVSSPNNQKSSDSMMLTTMQVAEESRRQYFCRDKQCPGQAASWTLKRPASRSTAPVRTITPENQEQFSQVSHWPYTSATTL